MIRILEPEVVSKIAAGEVVERPFSVLKEVVENAIDAGATRVEVDLEEGGRDLIRVRDNGRGMSAADLELAFVQHATSKLAQVEDLDAIVSLGFRGEALASIGSVSRTRIVSREAESDSAHEARATGGKIEGVRPAAGPAGTVVEVRDLFFNVPARRRFLRTPVAERTRCIEVLTKLALAHPEVGFKLSGRRGMQLQPGEALVRRIVKLFGAEVGARCLEVEHERGPVRVTGAVVDPDGARRDRSGQHLFVNGRPIRDRSLQHAVDDAYREFLMGGRHPIVFLFVQLDPERVDVNVHPTKSEVRFVEARLVYSAVRGAVLEALGARGHAVAQRATEAGAAELPPRPVTGFPDLPPGLFGAGAAIGESFGQPAPERVREPSPFRPVQRFLVIHDLYIVIETAAGFAVVDQHALHERVVYERLLAEWRRGEVAVQRLLVPAVIELTPAAKELLLARIDAFAQCGLLIRDFGGNSIKLEGYPAALRRVDPRALVEGVLADLADGEAPREAEDLRERFHSAACRSAVMAGDKLSDDEIAALLAQAAELEHPHNCPHGRPTVINYASSQLERFFKRRV